MGNVDITRESKVIAAVDVSTTKVVVVMGQLDSKNNVQILGWGESKSEGLVRGEVRNAAAVVDAIDRAIEKVDVDEVIDEVHVSVSGVKFSSFDITIERSYDSYHGLRTCDMESMIREAYKKSNIPEDHTVYHIEPQGFMVDGEHMADPCGTVGEHFEGDYRLFTGVSSYVKKLTFAIEKSYLRVDRVVMDPITSATQVLSEDDKEAGVVLLEIGAGLTKIAIYTDGNLRYVAASPLAGDVMTNDLMQECGLTKRSAEELKVKRGEALSDQAPKNVVVEITSHNGWENKRIGVPMLAAILQSRLEEIVKWVSFHIEKSGFADSIGAGLVITGGTSKMKGINTLFNYHLGMDVKIGTPHIANHKFTELEDPMYASVLGLLKHGLEDQVVDFERKVKLKDSRKQAKKKAKEKKAKQAKEGPSLVGRMIDMFASKADAMFSADEGDQID